MKIVRPAPDVTVLWTVDTVIGYGAWEAPPEHAIILPDLLLMVEVRWFHTGPQLGSLSIVRDNLMGSVSVEAPDFVRWAYHLVPLDAGAKELIVGDLDLFSPAWVEKNSWR